MIKNTVVTDLVNAMGLTFGMDYSTQKSRKSLNVWKHNHNTRS